MEGRIRRLPIELDNLIQKIQVTENLSSKKKAFLKLTDYAIIGKEIDRLGRGFGIKVVK
jgi:hypothetical protein